MLQLDAPVAHGGGEPARRMQEDRNGPARQSSALRAVSAVLGAFIGIRKSSARDRDLANLKPVHVIVAGILAAALFVIIIVTLVNLIA
jgi:hypothetical protein